MKAMGCIDHFLEARPKTPTTTEIAAVTSQAWEVAMLSSAMLINCGLSTWAKGVPVRSDITKGTSRRATMAMPNAAKAPVRAAICPSTVRRDSMRRSLSLSGICGEIRKAETMNDPTDNAISSQATARKNGSPKVVRRPGSGIPSAASESARKNKEMKPPTNPAKNIALAYNHFAFFAPPLAAAALAGLTAAPCGLSFPAPAACSCELAVPSCFFIGAVYRRNHCLT